MLAARTLPRDRSAAEGEREGRGRKEGGGEEGKEATDASHSGLEDVGDSLPLVVRHVLEVRVDLLPEVPPAPSSASTTARALAAAAPASREGPSR
jgi:hypothetical protein